MTGTITTAECCPRFDPTPWQEKTFTWTDKKFIKDSVFSLFYIPLNFGNVMTRMQKKVEDANGKMVDYLCLSGHVSPWTINEYIAVDSAIPNTENVTSSGTFFSKVYEGSFSETEKWMTDFVATTKEKGLKITNTYLWYTTCPECAKKYGKNYVVIIGKSA